MGYMTRAYGLGVPRAEMNLKSSRNPASSRSTNREGIKKAAYPPWFPRPQRRKESIKLHDPCQRVPREWKNKKTPRSP